MKRKKNCEKNEIKNKKIKEVNKSVREREEVCDKLFVVFFSYGYFAKKKKKLSLCSYLCACFFLVLLNKR